VYFFVPANLILFLSQKEGGSAGQIRVGWNAMNRELSQALAGWLLPNEKCRASLYFSFYFRGADRYIFSTFPRIHHRDSHLSAHTTLRFFLCASDLNRSVLKRYLTRKILIFYQQIEITGSHPYSTSEFPFMTDHFLTAPIPPKNERLVGNHRPVDTRPCQTSMQRLDFTTHLLVSPI
jgi:hypothetical protein